MRADACVWLENNPRRKRICRFGVFGGAKAPAGSAGGAKAPAGGVGGAKAPAGGVGGAKGAAAGRRSKSPGKAFFRVDIE